jgi:enamine deaminase RidA (YjgF/YER057c/UK114 family)
MRRSPVADQVRRALENVERVARAAGGTLAEAVRADVPPARTTIQSNLREFAVEIDAVTLPPEED